MENELETLKIILDMSTYPVAYRVFHNHTELPYIVYYVSASNNLLADNEVYKTINNYTVELYTDLDNFIQACSKLEYIFKIQGIAWNKIETYISEEEMFQISYNFTFLPKAE